MDIIHHLNAKKPVISGISNVLLKFKGEYHYLLNDDILKILKKIEIMTRHKLNIYSNDLIFNSLYFVHVKKLKDFKNSVPILNKKNHYFYGTIFFGKDLDNLNAIILFFIAHDIPEEIYNPDILIEKIANLNIIRDDQIIGGTKFRAIVPFLDKLLKEKPNINELVYFGASNGIAQLALAYYLFLKKSKIRLTIFLQETNLIDSLNLVKSVTLLYPYSNYRKYKEPMKLIWPKMEEYLKQNKNSHDLPFGLDDDTFKLMLSKSLEKKLINVQINRIWLVAGSGTLLSILMNILKKTKFNAVQVGKYVNTENFETNRLTLYVSKYK